MAEQQNNGATGQGSIPPRYPNQYQQPGAVVPRSMPNGYQQMPSPDVNSPMSYAGSSAQAGYEAELLSSLRTNYWLSAFLGWLPALIYWSGSDSKPALIREHDAALFNFHMTRFLLVVGFFIPIVNVVAVLASLALFVLGIIAAATGPDKLRAGQVYKFPFSIKFVKAKPGI